MGFPAPKDKSERRHYSQPARGEWVDLPGLDPRHPVLPKLSSFKTLGTRNPDWHERAEEMWEAIRVDPVSTQYGPADVQAAKEFIRLFNEMCHGVGVKDNELRLRMDGLGLTPKGKRDLRWRTPAETATIKAQEDKPRAEARRIRAV